MSVLGTYSHRLRGAEKMDDFSIQDERLLRALHELRYVNRFLGGYRSVYRAARPVLSSRRGKALRVLDIGAGLADAAPEWIAWGDRFGTDVSVTALDANEATVGYAREFLDARLGTGRRHRAEVVQGDARRLPYEDASFDVVTASLFLHHFEQADGAAILAEMARVASHGIIVSDLHRHVLAYLGIRLIALAAPVSDMFEHDAPMSVRRGFTPGELLDWAAEAGLASASVRWGWAFRLTLSTLGSEEA